MNHDGDSHVLTWLILFLRRSRVKKNNGLIIFTVLSLLALSVGAFASESGVGGKPSAFFPVTLFEFAPVPEGTVIEHDYPVRNRGTADLEIFRISSD